jgi:hypothetical protein
VLFAPFQEKPTRITHLPTTGLAGDLHIHGECDFVMSVLGASRNVVSETALREVSSPGCLISSLPNVALIYIASNGGSGALTKLDRGFA